MIRRLFLTSWPDGRVAFVSCRSPSALYQILEAECDITNCRVAEYNKDVCLIFKPQTSIYTEEKQKAYCTIDDPQDKLSEHMADLLESGDFSDVTLHADGKNFKCHRAILSARSAYFKAMFSSQLRESSDDSVELEGFSSGVIKIVLSYIYTGQFMFDNTRKESEGNSSKLNDKEIESSAEQLFTKLEFVNTLLVASDFFNLLDLSKHIQKEISELSASLQMYSKVEHLSCKCAALLQSMFETADGLNLTDLKNNIAFAFLPFLDVGDANALPDELQKLISKTYLLKNHRPRYFSANSELYTLLTQGDLSLLSTLSEIKNLQIKGASAEEIFAGHLLVNRAGDDSLFEPQMDESIWQVIEYFLNSGYPVNYLDYRGQSMLHEAAINGNEDFVQRLLTAGASPSCQDSHGLSVIQSVMLHCDNDLSYYLCSDLILSFDFETEARNFPENIVSLINDHHDIWTKARSIIAVLEQHSQWKNSSSPECGELPDVCVNSVTIKLDESFIEDAEKALNDEFDVTRAVVSFLGKQDLNIPSSGMFSSELHKDVFTMLFPNFMKLMNKEHKSSREMIRHCLEEDIKLLKFKHGNQLCSLSTLKDFSVFFLLPPHSWIHQATRVLSSRNPHDLRGVAKLDNV